jgi:hypothetical protein
LDAFDVEKEEAQDEGSDYDSDDESPAAVKWRRRKALRRQLRELREKYTASIHRADAGGGGGLDVLSLQSSHDGEEGSVATASVLAAARRDNPSNLYLAAGSEAFAAVGRAVDSTIVKGVIAPAGKTVASTLNKLQRRTLRRFSQAVDVATIRTKKIFATMDGTFDEIQKEMKFEIYHQYVQHQVAVARQKALNDFAVIETGLFPTRFLFVTLHYVTLHYMD